MTKEAMEPVAWQFEPYLGGEIGGDAMYGASKIRIYPPYPTDKNVTPLYTAAQLQQAREEERAACVAWLRERAEKQFFREPDPEQPGYEREHQASCAVAYNALHMSALYIERGEHREVGK